MDEKGKQELIWREVMEEMYIIEFQDWLHHKMGDLVPRTEYEKSRISADVCCPSCFKPVEAAYSRCPNCGFTLDMSLMETLRDNAFELAAFAWNYRRQYEKDIAKGKIYQGRVAVRYFLTPPAGWLIYLVSIVFAAIIGGLSYDAFKKLLPKISDSFRKRFQREIPRGKWRQQLYNNLREYFFGRRDPDSPIFRAYIKGLIKGSQLRAEFERSPDFEVNLIKTLQSIIDNVGSGASELEIPDPSLSEPPSEVEMRKHLRELVEKHAKRELAVKQLQEYLSNLSEKNV